MKTKMNSKKWLVMFAAIIVGVALILPVFNIATDPFGVFGDKLLDWYSYNITNNPRVAKIKYLDEHWEEYDSYIIGCSSTSSFAVEDFNKYLDANFYNMIMYGADMLDVEQMVEYMIENYTVKNLVVNVYIDNGVVYNEESNEYTHSMPARVDGSSELEYYSRYLFATPSYGMAKLKALSYNTWLSQYFDIFDTETGSYDKRRRDIEPISDTEDYFEEYPEFTNYPNGNYLLLEVKNCLESMTNIRDMCEENGVNLIVVTAPVYYEYMNNFYPDAVASFYTRLAEIVDFWDFSYSSVSFEPRYFYDRTHFRNNVGKMAAARIFGDDSIYIPEDFGRLVTAENAEETFAWLAEYSEFETVAAESTPNKSEYEKEVPVLMYHHISENVENDMIVTPETFRAQMQTLLDAGYTAITLEQMRDYVYYGTELPEKPILITFDDGYMSNYEYAYPILKELGMHAVIFTVGVSFGKDTYLDTDIPINPHFGEAEAREMEASGVIDIQSHTYDMHRNASYEDNVRTSVQRFAGESYEDYINALRSDFTYSIEFTEEKSGGEVFALSYPQGVYTDEAAAVAKESGFEITFSTRWGIHTLVKGLDQSLMCIKRLHVSNETTAEELLERIGYYN